MDLALYESREIEEFPKNCTQNGILVFDYTKARFRYEVTLFNISKIPIYCRTSDGTIAQVPRRVSVASDINPELYIRVVHQEIDQSRKVREKVQQYKVNPRNLDKGCAVYIKLLDLWVSPDRDALVNVPDEKNISILDQLKAKVHRALYDMRQCPISVIIADPTREINYVYAILDRSVYKLPVLHTRDYGKHCVVKFQAVDHMESDVIYDFELDEMKAAFAEHQAFTPRVGSYELQLFGTLEDAQEVLTEINTKYTKTILGITAREKEAAKLEYTNKIASLEGQIGDLTRQNEALRKQVEVMNGLVKIDDEAKKREHSTEIQHLQLDKEKAKVDKSRNDVTASEVGATATTVKAAAIIIPAICGVLGICAVKFGWIGVAKSMFAQAGEIGSSVLSSLGGVVRSVLAAPFKIVGSTISAIGSVAGAAMSGIAKVGSWISSWF